MGDPVTALVVVAGVSGAGKVYSQRKSELAQLDALDFKREQQELQYQQKTLSNFELTNKILDTQMAQASTRGVSMYSPSLEAIQRATLNTSSKNQKNLDIEEKIYDRNIRIEKRNVRDTFIANLFGDVTDFAKSASSLAAATPTKVS